MEAVPSSCLALATEEQKGSADLDAGAAAPIETEEEVTELMERLNLTMEEASAVILEDENEEHLVKLDWALIGKVLSPNTLHIQTIMSALRPAWGNPKGLSAKSVGENSFIVEFASKEDLDRILAGAPWTIGRHAVLFKSFDPKLKPSEVTFDRISLWARIKDPRFELMNKFGGESLGAKIGKVEKVDVDNDGRACGDCLRVRVSVEISKPLMRCVTAYSKKHKALERFEVQFERLPYYCFSCGIIGHSSLECPNPGVRDEDGKLPYNADRLCVKDERKKAFSGSISGHSSQSSGKSTQFWNSKGDTQPYQNREPGKKDANTSEVPVEVTSSRKKKEQSSKQKRKDGYGETSNEITAMQGSLARTAGQKRKQVKVYRPKNQALNCEEKTPQGSSNLELILGGQNSKINCPFPTTMLSGDEGLQDSYKKQEKEGDYSPSRSADQAEAAGVQPRHTQ